MSFLFDYRAHDHKHTLHSKFVVGGGNNARQGHSVLGKGEVHTSQLFDS